MNSLVPNGDTGFLEANNDHNSFTSDRKLQFLQLTHEFIDNFQRFPSIHSICKKIGITVRTFERHKQHDPVFREAWNEVISVLKSVYDSNIAEKAEGKNGIIAALSIRKYLETGSFVQQVNVNSNDQMSTNKKVIDAIIVETDPEIPQPGGNASISPTNIQNNSDKPA